MNRFTAVLIAVSLVAPTALRADSDWTQFGNDSQRTFLVTGEKRLNKHSVSKLKLHWKIKLDNRTKELNSLTTPVIVTGLKGSGATKDIAIVAGSDDNVFALNADSGALLWSRHFKAFTTPTQKPDWLCPNALTATPVIDKAKGLVYVLASDGRLYTLDIRSGHDCQPPRQFTPAFAKTWSLNLFHGTIYTPTSQACNQVRSAIYAISAEGGGPKEFLAMHTYGAGIWGRAGVAIDSERAVFAGTGDGIWNPAEGQYPDSILAVDGTTLRLKDYFTPSDYAWVTKKDLDMGNMSPVVFRYGAKELVAASGKEGVIWLLDAHSLGGPNHMTPLYASGVLANAEASYFGHGFWGAFATYVDKHRTRWLYAPAWGPPTDHAQFEHAYGPAPSGSIMAFQVDGPDATPVLKPVWRSVNMDVPEPPVIANNVVFAVSDGDNINQNDASGRLLKSEFRAGHPGGHAILYALDAQTGGTLYSSGNAISGFAHFSGLAVAGGQIFVVTWDNTVYAFSTH